MGTPIIVAKNSQDIQKEIVLHSEFVNRHGLIAGTTGTGKRSHSKCWLSIFQKLEFLSF